MGELAPIHTTETPNLPVPEFGSKQLPESNPGPGNLGTGQHEFSSFNEPNGVDEGLRPQTQTEAAPPAPPAGPPEGPPDDNDRVEEAFLERVNPEDNKSEIPLKRPEDFAGNGDNQGQLDQIENENKIL